MRKLLLLFTAGLLAGCSNPVVPEHGIVVVASANPVEIQAGATMNIALTIENIAEDDRQLANSPCFPLFEVLNSLGTVVGPTPSRICTAELRPPITLSPGASHDAVDVWRGESTESNSAGEPIYLPAGTYYLRPRTQVVDYGYVYGPPITVTIKP